MSNRIAETLRKPWLGIFIILAGAVLFGLDETIAVRTAGIGCLFLGGASLVRSGKSVETMKPWVFLFGFAICFIGLVLLFPTFTAMSLIATVMVTGGIVTVIGVILVMVGANMDNEILLVAGALLVIVGMSIFGGPAGG